MCLMIPRDSHMTIENTIFCDVEFQVLSTSRNGCKISITLGDPHCCNVSERNVSGKIFSASKVAPLD